MSTPTTALLARLFSRRRYRTSVLMVFLALMLYLMLSYQPHYPTSNEGSLRTAKYQNLKGLRTLPPLAAPNHNHQFVLVLGSTSSGSKLATSLCALCLGLTDTIRNPSHAGYGDMLLEGRSDLVLHRSLPHGFGTPISNPTTLDMLIGRHGEMFVDPITLEKLAMQRNYTTKFILVVRDESTSIVSSVANRHARGFKDAREHMNRTHQILKSLMANNNTLVIDYEGLVQYWDPLWKSRLSTFLHCPASRFQKVDRWKDGNQKYIFSMKAYVMEVMFRLRIL